MQDASRQRARVSKSGVFEVEDIDLANKARVEAAIKDIVAAEDYVAPTLPRAAMDVIALSQKPEVSFVDLERIMNADPLLAARVLRRAQSPLFAGGKSIHSLRDALVRIGIMGIRNVVLEESIRQRVFRAGQYQALVEAVADHASRTAVAARCVARFTALSGDYLYMLGLLHDVGVGLALSAIVDRVPRELHPSLRDVIACVTDVHAELGGSLTKTWGLPAEVTLVVKNHHDAMVGGFAHPLVCVLICAEALVERAGVTSAWDRRSNLVEFAMSALGVSEAQVRLAHSDYLAQIARR